MARKCFACARVGSEDILDIYTPRTTHSILRGRTSPVPLLTRQSPSPALDDIGDHLRSISCSPSPVPISGSPTPANRSPILITGTPIPSRRCYSSHTHRFESSSEGIERQDDKLLHPNVLLDSSETFCQHEKKGLKQLSCSAPSMTCAPLDLSPALTPTTCRSRQKKFQRHFNVDPDEQVIDYYSCALVADILLQGHLYVSRNYFAFYSNVFGYITKLLIPITSVTNVTKEKTAFILPNAVGVTTADDRHVFSSLLSRDTTYRLMVQAWHSVHSALALENIVPPAENVEAELPLREDSSSPSGSESTYNNKPTSANTTDVKVEVPTLPQLNESPPQTDIPPPASQSLFPLQRSTVLLTVATTLLVVLFLSASVLIYRVSLLQHTLSVQSSQGSRALYEVKEFLDANLNHLYKVRESIEILSIMIESEKNEHEKTKKVENNEEDKLKTLLFNSETDLRPQTEEWTTS